MIKQRQYRGGYQLAGLVELARELRKKQTSAEALLWQLLRDRRLLGFKFRPQHQFGDYVTDFYCREAGLAIECDGAVHERNEQWHHDRNRDAYMLGQGVRVLRIPNERILNETVSVLEEITKYLSAPKQRKGGEGVALPSNPLTPTLSQREREINAGMAAPSTTRLMIVAGEASGDAHAAALVRALRTAAPERQIDFFGSTGAQMRAAGVDSIVDADQLAILGLWEIGQALPKFWRAFGALKRAAIDRKPDAVVLVDWPDFNLRLARWLHRRGVRVIYYISPQLWAWRSYRVHGVQRDVDLLLSILPFEKDWYAKHGMTQVEYVGHPLTGEVRPRYDRQEFCRRHDFDPSRPLVALLPGSRHKELVRILPPMLEAAAMISQVRSDVQFVVVVAANRSPREAGEIIAAGNNDGSLMNSLRVIHHETREALAAASAAAIASGTATLEAALLATPLVVVYKESALNWHTLGSLITAEHYGLVNLIAQRRLATELIQDQFSGESLARELLDLLDPDRNAAMRAELKEVAEKIGDPGASDRAARVILNFMDRRS